VIVLRGLRGVHLDSVFWALDREPTSFICGNAGDALADHQRVDVIGTFIGLDGFEVAHVAHERLLVRDSVRAEKIASHSSTIERHGRIIALQHRNVSRDGLSSIFKPPNVQRQ